MRPKLEHHKLRAGKQIRSRWLTTFVIVPADCVRCFRLLWTWRRPAAPLASPASCGWPAVPPGCRKSSPEEVQQRDWLTESVRYIVDHLYLTRRFAHATRRTNLIANTKRCGSWSNKQAHSGSRPSNRQHHSAINFVMGSVDENTWI